jgi:SAM-dependent methyltransferase
VNVPSLVDRREVEKLLVLAGALRSGLVDAVSGSDGRTAEQAADLVGGDPHACRVLLDALVSIGVAELQGDTYRLTALGREHLVDPPPGSPIPPELERSSLLHQAGKFEGWLRLPAMVAGETGSSGVRSPERLRSFVRTMGEGDPAVTEEVVDRVLAYLGKRAGGSDPLRMIDVGGAVGHMARLFADRGLQATLFDRPEVLPEAREFLGERAADIEMVGGDFTAELPPGPYDLAYLGNVYHIYGPGTLAALTARVFSVLGPGGVICVRDYVWERSERSPMFAVNMLQATQEGGVWREADYREWLSAAGFVDVTVVDLDRSSNQLVLGRRP